MPRETHPQTEHSKPEEWVPARLVRSATDEPVDEGMRISNEVAAAALAGDYATAAQLVPTLPRPENK